MNSCYFKSCKKKSIIFVIIVVLFFLTNIFLIFGKDKKDVEVHNRSLVCGEDQIIDIQGNRYNTVEIGGICWMAENLRYLPSVSPSLKGSTTDPYYYVYGYQGTSIEEAKKTNSFQKKGVLYNWPAAMKACPPGTRLPTDEEWHVLENSFATEDCDPDRSGLGCNFAGTALMASVLGGINSSGFTAISAGRRASIGSFRGLSAFAHFWSSSEYSTINAWSRHLHSDSLLVDRDARYKHCGFSVRCVTDKEKI